MSFFTRIFGGEKTALEKYGSELNKINGFKEDVFKLTQEEIQSEISNFKLQIAKYSDRDSILTELKNIRPRVFALVREAAARSIGQTHYDVQMLGGLALSDGRIAEMKTGEGKTLTATAPMVLYALAGRGAHLVTVNDYLARWQASLMGPVYKYLGLSVASIQHEASFLYDPSYQPGEDELKKMEGEVQGLVMDVKHMRKVDRKEAYMADITYGTNNEFGFDYLRDNMAQHTMQLAQRDLFFAIVDEVDSILIDEARTPLIISAPDTEPTSKYYDFAKLVEKLDDKTDYIIDEKKKATSLTDAGINKIEKLLNVPNIYDTSKGVTTIHHIEQSLRAKTLFKKDRDYVVREGEIVIVDEFTGRMMFGRRYSEGLHQAIEAKENVEIQAESKTLATITFQNLFRLYWFLAGMTGTAKTEEEEFFKIYRLQVEQVPTNKPNARLDGHDMVYKTEDAKFKAIAKEVKERNKKGQPVLIGTVSIAKNEILAEHLKSEGLKFEILNAKNHEREANIISQAGRLGQITLATNIAGRGVDILLGGNPPDLEEAEEVKKAGGLHVLGTERHESRRIDNQLRGRSGRQGDPGSSQFFVSMEDDLMRLFGGERMKSLMTSLGLPDDQPIEARLVSRSIESAQKKIEGLNFDTRKHVLEFDDVLNHQRNHIYKLRRKYLPGRGAGAEKQEEANDEGGLKSEYLELVEKEIETVVKFNLNAGEHGSLETPEDRILKELGTMMPIDAELTVKVKESGKNSADKEFAIIDTLTAFATELLEKRQKDMGTEVFDGAMRFIALSSIDQLWMEHLDTMDHLRDSVRLRGYGQRDPLVEYKKEGHELFKNLLEEINKQMVYTVFKIQAQIEASPAPAARLVTNKSDSADSGQLTSESGSVGRNDPCPCGAINPETGKAYKYKRCGMINAPYHKK
ncbi:MAG: preprotein translocase subunit SecA [Candidatus Doudnabacteria bacterium]|nr:preprotein translocase subunit SecA [Candidatus Doudnabacteria bacterium]